MSRTGCKKDRPAIVEIARLVLIKVSATEIARWIVEKIGPYLPFGN